MSTRSISPESHCSSAPSYTLPEVDALSLSDKKMAHSTRNDASTIGDDIIVIQPVVGTEEDFDTTIKFYEGLASKPDGMTFGTSRQLENLIPIPATRTLPKSLIYHPKKNRNPPRLHLGYFLDYGHTIRQAKDLGQHVRFSNGKLDKLDTVYALARFYSHHFELPIQVVSVHQTSNESEEGKWNWFFSVVDNYTLTWENNGIATSAIDDILGLGMELDPAGLARVPTWRMDIQW